MGSTASKSDDQQHLLAETNDTEYEAIPPFEEINIVLIGYGKAGKNKIGNAILGKKAFTCWNTGKEHYLKEENTTFGRRVRVSRAPGWSGVLISEDPGQRKIQQVIKDSAKSFRNGPHAVVLVVKTIPMLTLTTRNTLKKLLGPNLSEHTLVFSTDGVKISFVTMTDLCVGNKEEEINGCSKINHFFKTCTCGEQNMAIIKTLEDFILRKNVLNFYPTGWEALNTELEFKQLHNLIKRLDQKISVLSESISKLQQENQMKTDGLQKKIKRLEDEKTKLNDILRQKEELLKTKEEEIKKLTQGAGELSVLHGRIKQLEDEARQGEILMREKDGQIARLTKENKELKDKLRKPKLDCMPSGTRVTSRPPNSPGARFVGSYRGELIQRVASVDPILDELVPLIGTENYAKIMAAPTSQAKMRELYKILDVSGQKLKENFHASLLKHEKCLVEDLLKSGKPQLASSRF